MLDLGTVLAGRADMTGREHDVGGSSGRRQHQCDQRIGVQGDGREQLIQLGLGIRAWGRRGRGDG
jgi:hypothetical protein